MTAMLNTTFPPWPCFTDDEATAVRACLLSNKVNYWTGTECRLFEKEFAQWAGVDYAVALSNGTLALDIALKALKIGIGDEVVVTPRTFLASVSCVVNAGAIPVFADIDSESGNITADSIRKVLSPRTRGIICVHLAGWPCDMDPIIELAFRNNINVIEDCAQAHGARYKGRNVGSIGHVGAWSFCQDKIITTGGEGGMVTTNSETLWREMWAFKDHGKSYEAVYERQHPPGFRWLHESFGTNWRMMEMQAVIGRTQLHRMEEWNAQRSANAAALASTLAQFSGADGPVRVPQFGCAALCRSVNLDSACSQSCRHAQYKFYAYVRPERLAEGWTRDRIVQEFVDRGVPCYQGSCSEVYLEKAFDGTGWRPEHRLPVARLLGETSLMWLVHPTLRPEDIKLTQEVMAEVLSSAAKN